MSVIPKHCFERSAIKSSAYVLLDFAMIAALVTAVSQTDVFFGKNGAILNGPAGQVVKAAAWMTYCECSLWNGSATK